MNVIIGQIWEDVLTFEDIMCRTILKQQNSNNDAFKWLHPETPDTAVYIISWHSLASTMTKFRSAFGPDVNADGNGVLPDSSRVPLA